MKKYNVFLFDLDGTLTDSSEGIFKSFEYALEKFGIEIGENKKRLIGPPIMNSFRDFYGMDDAQAEKATNIYRERYGVKGLFENRVYDGIEEVLAELKRAGKTVLVATSKPEKYAREIMEYFDIAKYFDYVAGAAFKGYPDTKKAVIECALKALDIHDKSDILMIGDRYHDVVGAHALDIDCLGILYGFGCREELEQAGADYIESDVEDILKFL